MGNVRVVKSQLVLNFGAVSILMKSHSCTKWAASPPAAVLSAVIKLKTIPWIVANFLSQNLATNKLPRFPSGSKQLFMIEKIIAWLCKLVKTDFFVASKDNVVLCYNVTQQLKIISVVSFEFFRDICFDATDTRDRAQSWFLWKQESIGTILLLLLMVPQRFLFFLYCFNIERFLLSFSIFQILFQLNIYNAVQFRFCAQQNMLFLMPCFFVHRIWYTLKYVRAIFHLVLNLNRNSKVHKIFFKFVSGCLRYLRLATRGFIHCTGCLKKT